MIQRRLLFATAAMTFVSLSAMAQTGPCSAGIQDPPIFTVVVDGPPGLRSATPSCHPVRPVVTIEGNEITVFQRAFETLVAPPRV